MAKHITLKMDYKISNIRLAGKRWLGDVEYWEGCQCSSEVKTVEVYKDKKPSKGDFIRALLKD